MVTDQTARDLCNLTRPPEPRTWFTYLQVQELGLHSQRTKQAGVRAPLTRLSRRWFIRSSGVFVLYLGRHVCQTGWYWSYPRGLCAGEEGP